MKKRLSRKGRVWVVLVVLLGIYESSSARAPYAGGWRSTWKETPAWGTRAGYIDSARNLRVCVGLSPEAPWVTVARGVKDFQLMDNRLAVLQENRELWFAEGSLDRPLRRIDTNIAAYQMTYTRIGALRTDGSFRVKEEGFEPRTVATGVCAFHLLDDRVALLGCDQTLWVQQGGTVGGSEELGAAAQFKQVAKNVVDVRLERGWLAYLDQSNQLHLAKGDFWTAPTFEKIADDVRQFDLDLKIAPESGLPWGLRIAAVDSERRLLWSETDTSAARLVEASGLLADEVQWVGPAIVVRQGKTFLLSRLSSEGSLGIPQKLADADALAVNVEGIFMAREGPMLRTFRSNPANAKGSLEVVREHRNLSLRRPSFALSSKRPFHQRRPAALPSAHFARASPSHVAFLRAVPLQVESALTLKTEK